MEDLRQRVEKLEEWKTSMDTRMAIAETDIRTIKEYLTVIKDNTTWILRLVGGSIILALLGIVLKGGGVI